jgi:putative peptidoglycan binding protein
MKKITTLMIVASMALTGAVMAQESTPEASQPATKKQAPPEKKPRAEKPTTTKAPKSDTSAVKESTATESPAPTAPTKTDRKSNRKNPSAVAPNANAEKSPAASATPDATKNQSRKNNKNSKAPASSASASPSASTAKTTATPAAKASASTAPVASTTPAAAASTTPAAAASTTPVTGATINPVTTPGASAAPSASQNASTNVAAAKKLDTQKVEQIKQQHTSFRAQARPDRVPAVTFSANFRLPGSEHWQGPQYEVYRSYHPERHDRGWYTSRHPRVELIAGGYYYFDNGYWYPAWGYDSAHEYYAYDAPIYVGKRAEPPDRVIADVQAALQDMGYYKGEVDGLIGPLTRDALTKYQTDNGMTVTAVIDEPTLDSLNMG